VPPSSRDLIEEQLRELLEEQRENMRDGLTLRSLNRRVSEMERREIERLVEAGTGRYNIPPPGYNPPPVILDARGRPSRRPSLRPQWMEKILASKPVSITLAVTLAGIVSHLAARCGIAAQQAQSPPAIVQPLPPHQ
jgi:hypothetical protein